jgi:carbonic anhydrase
LGGFVDRILEHNRAFVRGRAMQPLPPPETVALAVLACYDPRLDDLLRPALGLGRGDGFLVRSAGAVVSRDGDPLRSLALAVFLFEASELLVVGHTSCRMASFPSSGFIDAFRRRGVAREAFGAGDLREWAGAIPDPRSGVRSSVATLRAASVLPRDLAIAGAVLDDASGALELVVEPGERVVVAVPAPAASSVPVEAGASAGLKASVPAPASVPPVAAPLPGGEILPWEVEDGLVRSVEAVRGFLRALEAKGPRSAVARLRYELGRETRPLAQLVLLEEFVRHAAGDSRDVVQAFEELRREAAAASGSFTLPELIDLFRRGPARDHR